jgi:hypothetical protein
LILQCRAREDWITGATLKFPGNQTFRRIIKITSLQEADPTSINLTQFMERL